MQVSPKIHIGMISIPLENVIFYVWLYTDFNFNVSLFNTKESLDDFLTTLKPFDHPSIIIRRFFNDRKSLVFSE